jgi:uncharacterized membrane protein YfcA
MLVLVFVALGAFGVVFSAVWAKQLAAARRLGRPDDPGYDVGWPGPLALGIGFVTNFFDMLGIGSFASTTAIFRLLRVVPDRLIPGTLIVGHTPATLAEAFITIAIIKVETQSLVLLIGSAVVGAWLGAGVVAGWSRRKVQIGMGSALLVAAAIMLAKKLSLLPAGGEALGLAGIALVIGMVGNFILGALMTIGIGAFAPSLIMFGLLGMNTRSIFPIMMGSCAFLMPVGSIRFLGRGSYSVRAALGLAIGGVPGVLLAAYVIKELPIGILNWIVLGVVVYTAVVMLLSAVRDKEPEPAPAAITS